MLTVAPRCPHCSQPLHRELPDDQWFDTGERGVRVRGEVRRLSWLSWSLLTLLREHIDKPVSNVSLEARLTELSAPEDSKHAVQQHVARLRKALQDTPYRISLVWGFGYKLERAALEAVAC